MKTKKYDGPERRQYFRYNIIYSPKDKARLKINDRHFEVVDFSQGGLRFLKDSPVHLERLFEGEVIFADGRRKKVSAEIIWEINEEVGIKYI
jgi:hypothetical protein